MALKDAQRAFIAALKSGIYQAEPRPDLATKNWLAVGKVSADDVIQMISACTEGQYGTYTHVDDARTVVHDFRSRWDGRRWIVKCYFFDATTFFLSVHPAN